MKKLLLSLVGLAALNATQAQNCEIFNADFESWSTEKVEPIFGGDSIEVNTPDLWLDFAGLLGAFFGAEPSLTKTEDAYSGRLAAKFDLEPEGGGGLLMSFPLGCNKRPSSLSGYWKNTDAQAGADTFSVTIVLAKSFNSIDIEEGVDTENEDLIGLGGFEFVGSSTGDYELFMADIEYYSIENPDSMMIIITASNYGTTNTEVFFDAFALNYGPVGIKEGKSNSIALFPNPTQNTMTITSESTIETIEVSSLKGELMNFTLLSTNSIDVSELASGQYLLKVITSEGVIHKSFLKE